MNYGLISRIESQEDVRGLLKVFNETWGAETLSELVTSLQETECLIYHADNKVVGYLFYGHDIRDSEEFIEITDIGVLEECRGKGYGKKLVEFVCLISGDKPIKLSVKETNMPARHVYEKVGFKPTLTIQNYYGVGADGIRMEMVKTSN